MDQFRPFPPTSPQDETPVETTADHQVIVGFRRLSPDDLPSLNRALGTSLDEERLTWLLHYFSLTEKRDATAGELRLFDALDHATRTNADRLSADALYTDSAAIADAWADAMARRHSLHPGNTSPCTPDEWLSLTQDWLTRTSAADGRSLPRHLRTGDTPSLAAGQALAAGELPLMRLLAYDEGGEAAPADERLLTAPAAERARRDRPEARVGDVLCLVRDVDLPHARALLWPNGAPRASTAATAIGGRPLPQAMLSLCSGAHVLPDRLPPAEGCYARAFCTVGTQPAEDGKCHYLLRLPPAGLQPLLNDCRRLGLEAFAFGRVNTVGRFTLARSDADVRSTGKDTPVVAVNASFLRMALSARAFTFHPPLPAKPDAPSVRCPWLYRAALPYPEAPGTDGACPAIIAPGASESCLYLPEEKMYVSAATTVLPDVGTAYARATDTLLAAVAALCTRGVRRKDMSLSVRLCYAPEATRASGAGDDLLFSAVCALYRASVELSLPMPQPCLTPTAGTACHLSVWAHTTVPYPAPSADRRFGTPGHALYLFFADEDDGAPAPTASAWEAWRNMTDALAGYPASGEVRALAVVHNGRTPADAWFHVTTAALCPLPAAREFLCRPHRLAFLVEAPTGMPLPGVRVGVVPSPASGENVPMESVTTRPHSTVVKSQTPGAASAAPVALLPLLRREDEPAVATLSAHLSARGYRCLPLPLATQAHMSETVFDDSVVVSPATEVRTITDTAVQNLAARLRHASLLALAIQPGDAALLLTCPALVRPLKTFLDLTPTSVPHPRLLILGPACLPAASAGYLPSELAGAHLSRVTTAPLCAVTRTSAPDAPSAFRVCTGELWAAELPDETRPEHKWLLHAPGCDIPDGFTAFGGRVLGCLNGLPDEEGSL